MSATNVKYLAVAETLKREILNGKYESRERFPSEEALVRRFGVSRPTVERALRELKREGLLESRSGSGSYLTFNALNATGAIGDKLWFKQGGILNFFIFAFLRC